jgi:hypothetical protein
MKKGNYNTAMPNPALKQLGAFIGEWESIGSHPMLPGIELRGWAAFEWMEGGAFVVGRTSSENAKIPSGISIYGSDNTKNEYFMLYVDERGVSRKCNVTLGANVLNWFRSGPEFSQRYSFRVSDDGKSITGRGEMSKDNGKTWEPDLNQTYTRIK